MYKNFLLLLALCVGSVYSRKATFRVIAIGSKVQVKIENGKTYNLPLVSGDEIYFAGKVSNAPNGDIKYRYIVDGVAESFTRTLKSDESVTFNDFYGRQETVKKLKDFTYPENNWKRSLGETELFDTAYIPTVHVIGENADAFFTKPSDNTFEKVVFYFKNERKIATDVNVSAKNKNIPKFQIRIKAKESIYGRRVLKFRNSGEDPTNLRQFIYGNMIKAVGMPSIRSNMVRLYYNKKPAGFYVLQDEAYSEGFLRTEFYGNDASASVGCAYDCSCGADPDHIAQSYGAATAKTCDTKTPLMKFGEALYNLDANDANQVKDFEKKWFDIESFHKAMSFEFLTGDWDGYWFATSNYVLYNDPSESTSNTYKFYYLTQDHDETFGVGLMPPHNTYGYDFPKQSYTTMIRDKWHVVPDDADHRVLVDKLIAGSPALQQRFQFTFEKIVENVFNPVVFTRVVDSYWDRYTEEMRWDFSFERAFKPKKNGPTSTFEDFLTNKDKPQGGILWGITQFCSIRAESIKEELCITWKGDTNPPSKSCVPKVKF